MDIQNLRVEKKESGGEILFDCPVVLDWFGYVLALRDWLNAKLPNSAAKVHKYAQFPDIIGIMSSCPDNVSCDLHFNNYSWPLANCLFTPINLNTSYLTFTSKWIQINIRPTTGVSREKIESVIRKYCKKHIQITNRALYIKMIKEFISNTNARVDEECEIQKFSRNFPPFIRFIEYPKEPKKAPVIGGNLKQWNICNEVYEDLLYSVVHKNIPCPDNIQGCIMGHFCTEYTISEEQKSRIDTFNNNKISIEEVSEKWQKYYDEQIEKRVQSILEDYFIFCGNESAFPLWEDVQQTKISISYGLDQPIYNTDPFEWKGPDDKIYVISEGTIHLKE